MDKLLCDLFRLPMSLTNDAAFGDVSPGYDRDERCVKLYDKRSKREITPIIAGEVKEAYSKLLTYGNKSYGSSAVSNLTSVLGSVYRR